MAAPLSTSDLGVLAICSVRYALGRMTYVVGEVCEIVRHRWPERRLRGCAREGKGSVKTIRQRAHECVRDIRVFDTFVASKVGVTPRPGDADGDYALIIMQAIRKAIAADRRRRAGR